jgi:hypothetical protein
MDLETAKKLEKQVTDQLEESVKPMSPEENEDSRTLAEIYQSLINRMAELVDHNTPAEAGPITEMISPTLNVTRTDGPLPNIGLRLKYLVWNNSHPTEKENRRHGFINQFDEIVIGVAAEWLHTPPLVTVDPLYKANSAAEKLKFGGVFAVEEINAPLEGFNLPETANNFRVLEESLDVYEAAAQVAR